MNECLTLLHANHLALRLFLGTRCVSILAFSCYAVWYEGKKATLKIVPKPGREDTVIATSTGKNVKVKKETIKLYSMQTRDEMHQMLQDKGFVKKSAERIELQRIEREKEKERIKKQGYVESHRGVKRLKGPPQSRLKPPQKTVVSTSLRGFKSNSNKPEHTSTLNAGEDAAVKGNFADHIMEGPPHKQQQGVPQADSHTPDESLSSAPMFLQEVIVIVGAVGVASMVLIRKLCKTNFTSIVLGRNRNRHARTV